MKKNQKSKPESYRVYTDISAEEYETLKAIKETTRLSIADQLRAQVRAIVANNKKEANA